LAAEIGSAKNDLWTLNPQTEQLTKSAEQALVVLPLTNSPLLQHGHFIEKSSFLSTNNSNNPDFCQWYIKKPLVFNLPAANS